MKKSFHFHHALFAVIPVLLTPALLFFLAEEWIDFGGGEKDILPVLPYFIWALVFFLAAVPMIIKRWPLRRWLACSLVISTVVLLLLAILTYLTNSLGVA